MMIKKAIMLSALISGAAFAQDDSARAGFTRDTTPPVTEVLGMAIEGFDDVTNLPGWIMDNRSNPVGTTDWFQGNPATFNAHAGADDAYIGANFNNTSGSDICNWLIMPDLGFLQTVSFWTRTVTGNTFPDRMVVVHSPTGGTATGDCFTNFGDFSNNLLEINAGLVAGGYPDDWAQFTANVNGTGRVAFVYYVADGGPAGSNSNFIGLDTVEYVAGSSEADLTITKSNNATGATVTGSSVVYTLSVSNNGPGDATNAVVSDILPGQVSYISNTCGANEAGGTVTWNIGSLVNAANVDCDIVVSVTSAGSISNTASVIADETDPMPANNSSTSVFSAALPEVDLQLSITNNVLGDVNLGDSVTFTETVTNNGPGDANNTVVSATLSSGLDYVSNDCGATTAGQVVTWNAGTVANGATTMCNIVTSVAGFGQLSVNGSVTADETDTVPANNAGSSSVNGPVQIIPTLSQYGIMLLLAGLFFVTRRRFAK